MWPRSLQLGITLLAITFVATNIFADREFFSAVPELLNRRDFSRSYRDGRFKSWLLFDIVSGKVVTPSTTMWHLQGNVKDVVWSQASTPDALENVFAKFQFDPEGRLKSLLWVNGYWKAEYDNKGRIQTLSLMDKVGERVIGSGTYVWNKNDILESIDLAQELQPKGKIIFEYKELKIARVLYYDSPQDTTPVLLEFRFGSDNMDVAEAQLAVDSGNVIRNVIREDWYEHVKKRYVFSGGSKISEIQNVDSWIPLKSSVVTQAKWNKAQLTEVVTLRRFTESNDKSTIQYRNYDAAGNWSDKVEISTGFKFGKPVKELGLTFKQVVTYHDVQLGKQPANNAPADGNDPANAEVLAARTAKAERLLRQARQLVADGNRLAARSQLKLIISEYRDIPSALKEAQADLAILGEK